LFWLSGASQFHSPNIGFLFKSGLAREKQRFWQGSEAELRLYLSEDYSPHRAWRRGDFVPSKGTAASGHFLEKLALIGSLAAVFGLNSSCIPWFPSTIDREREARELRPSLTPFEGIVK
jgi:hypothetical protein